MSHWEGIYGRSAVKSSLGSGCHWQLGLSNQPADDRVPPGRPHSRTEGRPCLSLVRLSGGDAIIMVRASTAKGL